MLKNIAAVLVGLLIAVAGVEGGVRILAGTLGISSYMKYDKDIGWTAEPGTTKHHKNASQGFDVVYKINEKGFRGAAYDAPKPAGVYRIVVLGDSNGFGWGIPEGKQFSAILDESLKNVEVINLSLSGYGTDQEYLRFMKEGVAYKPDLVIVQVTPNDFEEIQHPFFNQKPKPQFIISEGGNLALFNVPVEPVGDKCQEFYSNSLPLPFKDWLGWHSYAYSLFNEKYFGVMRQYSTGSGGNAGREIFSRHSVALFNGIISELKKRLDEVGAKGLVVHSSKEISENHYLETSAIPVLDLYPVFKAYSQTASRELYYKDGYHWNVEGHRIVAEEIAKSIEAYGVVPVAPAQVM
jgi:lysophospholipase L1-like esterase